MCKPGKRSLFLALDLPATPKEASNSPREQPDLSVSNCCRESNKDRGAVQETFFSIVLKKAGQEHSVPKCA